MSYLERRNPTAKLAVVATVSLLLLVVIDPLTPLVLACAIALAGILAGRIPAATFARVLWPLLVIAAGFVWTNAVFARTVEGAKVLAVWGPLHVSEPGLVFGLGIGLRGLAIGMLSVVFVLTTDPSDLAVSLIRHARLPFRLAYPLLAAYRFVPLFAEEYAQVALAQRIRGALPGRSPLARARRALAHLVPLLASAVRRAAAIAVAMDARGFAAARSRTYLREVSLTVRDVAFALVTVAAVLGWLAASAGLGWLRVWDGRFAA